MATRRTTGSNRQLILNAFERAVAERGYADTAMSEVASDVGVSKGTIVHHFGSKERMLAEIHLEFMKRRMHEVRYIKQTLHEPVEQLVAIIYAVLASHRDEYNGAKAFMREIMLFATSPEMSDVREVRRDYQASVTEVISRGIDEGVLRPNDVDLVTLQIFSMCNHTWTWYRPDGRYSMPRIAESFLQVVLGGLEMPPNPDGEPSTVAKSVAQAVRVVEESHLTASGRELFASTVDIARS
jgi:AcrR family transcriptional regulator